MSTCVHIKDNHLGRGALSQSIRRQKKFPVPFNIVLRTCEIYKENETLKVNAETVEKQIKESLIGLQISE